MKLTLAIVASIAAHEMAHVVCAGWLGVQVKRVGIGWRGVYIVRDSGTDEQNLAISLAGPVANLVLAGSFVLAPWLRVPAILFAMVNFGLGFINLLPIPGSDGRRVLNLLRKCC